MKLFARQALVGLSCICAIGFGGCCWADASLADRVTKWCDERIKTLDSEFKKVIALKTFDIAKDSLGGLVYNDQELSVSSTSEVAAEVFDYVEISRKAGAKSLFNYCLYGTKPPYPHLLPTIIDPLNFFVFMELNKTGIFDPNVVMSLTEQGEGAFFFNFYDFVLRSYVRGGGYDALYSEKGNELLVKFREKNETTQPRFRLYGLDKAAGVYFYFDSQKNTLSVTLTDVYQIKANLSAFTFTPFYIHPGMLADRVTEKLDLAELLEAAALLLKDESNVPGIFESTNLWGLINTLVYIKAEIVPPSQERKMFLKRVKKVIEDLKNHKNKNYYSVFGEFFTKMVKEIETTIK